MRVCVLLHQPVLVVLLQPTVCSLISPGSNCTLNRGNFLWFVAWITNIWMFVFFSPSADPEAVSCSRRARWRRASCTSSVDQHVNEGLSQRQANEWELKAKATFNFISFPPWGLWLRLMSAVMFFGLCPINKHQPPPTFHLDVTIMTPTRPRPAFSKY